MSEERRYARAGVRPVYVSDNCEIDLARREIRIVGSRVPLGGRAFEIVEILVKSAGQLVSKAELMDRVWPGAVVMEGTLHVHAAAVRRALGPYRDLLKTESRRGYRLLGDWTIRDNEPSKPPNGCQQVRATPVCPATNFPATVTRLIGRSAAVERLEDLISAYRLVTLTGPGGIGKTTLALEIARRVLDGFADGGWLVELASLSDPSLVPSAVAGVLGLRLETKVISAEAVAVAIGSRSLLLVLDNCEHIIDAAAALCGMLLRLCPHTTLLVTSRELLRIEGEHAYRVPPLEVPAAEELNADEILGRGAPELFISRAEEFGSDLSLGAESLQTIAAICRQLDGIPLAIELAAARAATLGIEQVAARLHDCFTLLTSGRRSALPRHRTLSATLDWSYRLLTGLERRLLQRLAVFSGSFSLDAAIAVAHRGDCSEAEILACIAELTAKSLVVSNITGDGGYFRLLETTRAYALSKLTQNGLLQESSRRHAEYYRDLLERVGREVKGRSTALTHIDNMRAALEWCFGPNGGLAIGVGLATAAAPVFLAMSLLPECHRWSKLAILALDDSARGGAAEMHLQVSLGVSSLQMHGQSDEAQVAFGKGLAIAEARGDVLNRLGMLAMLSGFHFRNGDFKITRQHAETMRTAVGAAEDSAAKALAETILGSALHFGGDLDGSRAALESAFRYWSRPQHESTVHLGYNFYIFNGIGLALTLWLQGYPAQGAERARKIIKEAQRINHPASLGLCLSWAPRLFLWIGDLASAEEHADWLISHAEAHSLGPYVAIARGYQGVFAIARGDAKLGVESLRRYLDKFHGTFKTGFKLSLVRGLAALGQFDESLALVDETIALIETKGDLLHMPEALRVKGGVFLSMPRRRVHDAEMCLVQSIRWSRGQGARSWELRAACDLAALWASQGQRDRARAMLQPVFETFMEGFDTADQRAAEHLLATLR